jgi:hypothetical protein
MPKRPPETTALVAAALDEVAAGAAPEAVLAEPDSEAPAACSDSPSEPIQGPELMPVLFVHLLEACAPWSEIETSAHCGS